MSLLLHSSRQIADLLLNSRTILSYSHSYLTFCRLIQTTSINYKRCKFDKRPKYRSWEFQHEPDYSRPSDEPAREKTWKESVLPTELAELRNKFPEFLPAYDPFFRHPLAHKIERSLMLQRRSVIDIPEFYVGSILAVTVSDPEAPNQRSRFLGICISRDGYGLRANFTLRNHIDNEGVEIRYEMYSPVIQSIEVIRLEKRVDDHLFYLRDAEPQYSTFPLDMQPEILEEGASVPVNTVKVKMNPRPWSQHWEWEYPLLNGVENFTGVHDYQYKKSRKYHHKFEHFDLMQEYRMHIPEEDQLPIWQEVKEHEDRFREVRRDMKRKKLLQRAHSK